MGTGPGYRGRRLEGEIAEEVVDFLQVVLGNTVGIFRIGCLADQDQRVCPVGAADIAIAEHGAEGKDRVQRPVLELVHHGRRMADGDVQGQVLLLFEEAADAALEVTFVNGVGRADADFLAYVGDDWMSCRAASSSETKRWA